jgi:hypothetical protein
MKWRERYRKDDEFYGSEGYQLMLEWLVLIGWGIAVLLFI